MVRVRLRCSCIAIIIISQVFFAVWFFSPSSSLRENLFSRILAGGQYIIHLTDKKISEYYAIMGSDLCVREGTHVEKSSEGNCICRNGWKGKRCGIPQSIQETEWFHNNDITKKLQLRKRPRRVIMVIPFTHEFDIFESNVNELNGLVDVFVIGEKNSTFNEDNMSPLLSKFKNMWLEEHQQKIVYIPLSDADISDGTFVETLVRLGPRFISDIRPDDIFLMTNGEEILERSSVLFLKLFQGYPLPIKCQFKHYLYGFYWKIDEQQPEVCAVTFHVLANGYEYEVSRLKRGLILDEWKNFFDTQDLILKEWTISNAGWKCHLCLDVNNIFNKLNELPEIVRPQWLTSTSTNMLPFIQRLIKFGQNEYLQPQGKSNSLASDKLPEYILSNKDKFQRLLKNHYEIMSVHKIV